MNRFKSRYQAQLHQPLLRRLEKKNANEADKIFKLHIEHYGFHHCNKFFCKETIRLSTTTWKPFVGKELEHYGSGTRIVTEAFALEGLKATYGFFPTKRALFVTQEGEWEGSFFWVRTPEREKYFYFSDIIRSNELVFFHLKSYRFAWETIDDLKEVRIGAVNGFVYTDKFEEAIKSGRLKVQFTASQEQNLNLLLKKRIDITPIVKQGGYYTINKIFTPEQAALLTHHPRPLKLVHLHLLLPKKLEKSKKILKLFNRGLQRLKENPETGNRNN